MKGSRRQFLAAAGAASAGAPAVAGRAPIPVAVIGTGGMGGNHLRLLAARKDVRVAAVCDVDANRLNGAVTAVQGIAGYSPRAYKDLRDLLALPEIQAVWVATPDHWHVPAAMLAIAAGKHVYVEKPCSHNIREGRLLLEAARGKQRVVQVGMQSRSTPHCREAIRLLREGVIGEILVAKAWNSQKRADIGRAKPSDPPAGLDYDLWVGPAPMVPYQSNRLHYTWHWWYDFGTGDMGNDGVHELDIARWGLGAPGHPVRVLASGGKSFFNDDQQFPDTQYVVFEYDDSGRKKRLIYEHRIWSPHVQEGLENGDAFYGTRGMMLLGKAGGFKVILAGDKPGPEGKGSPNVPAHHDNFLECLRTGARPNGDIEEGHYSAALCHLGNLAVRLDRPLRFNPETENFPGEERSRDYAGRRYRRGHWADPTRRNGGGAGG